MRNVLLLLLCILLSLSDIVAAEEKQSKPSSLPIEITAQQLDADRPARKATFSGEVIAKQGDITLYSDKLVVYSLPEDDQIDRLEAFGNVRVLQLDRTAVADRAIYRQVEGKLVLYGNAEVHQGQNQVTGDEIVVYLQENRSIVKSGENGRVKAVLFPKKEQEPE
ncbi:lipopolysaccharide transport periplasmic protein LptA [Malonomonas rubra]|uniref:lipopolysaccharide transport periplasmic protein LptA n=1 Tax=Malonomonas rubra TaxID=57040 RepID=UPI0026F13FF6|nr:lipopolysaccharide transport periplasmic protein LptA [Malonomonas rubra]